MNEINEIVSDIKSGRVKPIYLLTGEEPYYIDKISDFIQENKRSTIFKQNHRQISSVC